MSSPRRHILIIGGTGTFGSRLARLLATRRKYRITLGGRDGAVLGWSQLMKSIRPKIQQDAKMKEHYFDCYYYLTVSFYQNALRVTDAEKKGQDVRRAAGFLRQLEKADRDLTPELKLRIKGYLEKEPPLRSEYQNQGGTLFLPAADDAAPAVPAVGGR